MDNMRKILMVILVLFFSNSSYAEELSTMSPAITLENMPPSYGKIPGQFKEYTLVVESPKDEAEWWAGAPSALFDDGVWWLACRMRTPDAPRGLRGYELQLLKSKDGVNFKVAQVIKREDVPVPGFERPALLKDPTTGKYKLYACAPDGAGVWSIIKFDDADKPDTFKPDTARAVISPLPMQDERDIRPDGYKDAVIVFAEGAYHAYVIGTMRRTERIYHFSSPDGETWQPVGSHFESIMDLEGWHDFYVRPASVVPLGIGYLFVYEGSNVAWHDPVYNMGTGLAFSFDLHHITEITTEAPLVVSSTPSARFHTWRYSNWHLLDGEWWVYAEVTKPNESHEIRLFRAKF